MVFIGDICVCVCVFFVKRNRFCCYVFAVFSKTDFWLCVCFCVFFFPLKQIWLKVFCGFLRETDFGLLLLERFCCWVVLFWCCGSFILLGLLKS